MGFSFDTLIWCSILAFGIQCAYIGYRLPHEKAFRYFGAAVLLLTLSLLPEGHPFPQLNFLKKSMTWFVIASSLQILASLMIVQFIFEVTRLHKKQVFDKMKKWGWALISGLVIYSATQNTFSLLISSVVAVTFLIPMLLGVISLIEYILNSSSKNKHYFSLLLFAYIVLNISLIGKNYFQHITEGEYQFTLKGVGFFATFGTTFLMQQFLSVYRANKKTLDDLAFAYEKLSTSVRLQQLGVSTSEITHEIRNYAATLKGNATLIGIKSPLNAKRDEVKKIKSTAERMEKISMDVAIYAKSSTALIKLPINIDSLLRKVISLGFSPVASLFKIEIAPQVPDLIGDEEKLIQVFLNLFQNAIEANSKNILVRIKTLGSKLLVIIEDDGIGCDPKTLSLISKPFFTTKGVAGTGLGCSIADSVLRAHDATLRCYSKNALSANEPGLIFNLVFSLSKPISTLNSIAQVKVYCKVPSLKSEIVQPLLNLGIIPLELKDEDFLQPSANDSDDFITLIDEKTSWESAGNQTCIVINEYRIGSWKMPTSKQESIPFIFSEEKLIELILGADCR